MKRYNSINIVERKPPYRTVFLKKTLPYPEQVVEVSLPQTFHLL